MRRIIEKENGLKCEMLWDGESFVVSDVWIVMEKVNGEKCEMLWDRESIVVSDL